jgi:iron complex transport system ATP-binding protein
MSPFPTPVVAAGADQRADSGGRAALAVDDLRSGYGDRSVLDGIDLQIRPGTITCLVGPNGSGKSTLLKSCARLLDPQAGSVYLDGRALAAMSSRAVARRLAILPQGPTTPDQMTVRELVEQGRYPHAGPMRMLTRQDSNAIDAALQATGLTDFAARDLDALSGGERQRAWIALALAQDTPTLLLDEPTTFLDLGYQMEVLELVQRLNAERGLTVVMVVHDLNHATAVADRVVVLHRGAIVADGTPGEAITRPLLHDVFRVDADIVDHPRTGRPIIVTSGTAADRPTQRVAVDHPQTELPGATAGPFPASSP